MIEDLFRPIAHDGAATVEVGIRLQQALAALAMIDAQARADFRPEAGDALDRAALQLSSGCDGSVPAQLHHRLWYGSPATSGPAQTLDVNSTACPATA